MTEHTQAHNKLERIIPWNLRLSLHTQHTHTLTSTCIHKYICPLNYGKKNSSYCVVKWSEVTQSYPTLCDPVDCSPPGSSIHGIFQARILEWGAISSILLGGTVQKSLKTNALGHKTSFSGRIIFYFHACKISCLPFMLRDSSSNLLQANSHLQNQVRPQALPKLCGDVVKPIGSGIRLSWV